MVLKLGMSCNSCNRGGTLALQPTRWPPLSLSLSLSLSGETEEKVQGVYYGTFPGDEKISSGLTSVWVVSRPHNWRPATAEESLLHLSLPDGVEIERKPLPSSCALTPL